MNKSINERIKHYRRLANYTQAQMGRLIGMKTSTYSQMERQGQITCDVLLRLATALKVDATVLLLGEDYRNKESVNNYLPITHPFKNGKRDTIEVIAQEYNLINIFRHLSERKKTFACETIFDLLQK